MLPSVPTSLLLSWDEVGAFPLPAPQPGGDSSPPTPIAAVGDITAVEVQPFVAAVAEQECSQFELQLSQPAGPFVFSLYCQLMLFCD